jgi:alpha-beta hydrolase superfamily lysophospholipase
MFARRRLRWALIAFAGGIAIVAAISWQFATLLVGSANHPVTIPVDFRAVTVSIPSAHPIAGTWRDLGGNSPVVLLLHGFRGDRASMVPRARLLVEAGFSVLMIDQQAHGETPGEYITLGWRESADARVARDWIRTQAPGRRVGVIGVSLGGASVLLGSQPAGFDAVVLEAVYPRLRGAVENRVGLRFGSLNHVLAPLLLLQIEPRLHVTVEQLEPVRSIARVGAPVMVVGGSRDAHTREEETRELYAASAEPRELWIVDGATHEDFSRYDPKGYDEHVIAFLRHWLVPGGTSGN